MAEISERRSMGSDDTTSWVGAYCIRPLSRYAERGVCNTPLRSSGIKRFSDSHKNQSGITLIEILIVLAIMAGAAALVAGTLRSIFELDLEKAAQNLSSTIRYAYGASVRENAIYRLVIDVDHQKYWLESAPNAPDTLASIARETGLVEDEAESDEDAASSVQDAGEAGSDPSLETAEEARPLGFQPIDERVMRSKSLEPVRVLNVFTSHDARAVDAEKAMLYFFPNGSTEYAIINLTDEEGETTYSVEVNPLTGSTRLRSEALDPPSD